MPRWLPFLGGRRIPPRAAIVPVAFGGVAVTSLCLATALAPGGPLANPSFRNRRHDHGHHLRAAPAGAAGLILTPTPCDGRRRACEDVTGQLPEDL